MPSKGYKKADAKDHMLRMRITQAERDAYEKAAKKLGYRSVSAWLRELAGAAAGVSRPGKGE